MSCFSSPRSGRLAVVCCSALLIWLPHLSTLSAADRISKPDAADTVDKSRPATTSAHDPALSIVRIESFNSAGELCNRSLGFVAGPRLVVTNLHVARRGVRLVVSYAVGSPSADAAPDEASAVVAGVRGFDHEHDLLLLELEPSESIDRLVALPVSDGPELKAGSSVQIVPFTADGPAETTTGTLAAVDRRPSSQALWTLADNPVAPDTRVAGGLWLTEDSEVIGVVPGDFVAAAVPAAAVPARHLRTLLRRPVRKEGLLSLAEFQAALNNVSDKWLTLFDSRVGAARRKGAGQSAPVQSLRVLHFEGPQPGHPFLLGQFRNEGEWGVQNGVLQGLGGKQPVMRLATADAFELEGMISAEGTGGWFFLLGWDGCNGHLLYNVTLRTSGSPWQIAQVRDGAAVADDTHREVGRHIWKGFQPLRLTVEPAKNGEHQLTLQIGEQLLLDHLDLPDYAAGDVLLGTYDTRYGPKPVKIQSLRVRAR